MIPESCKRQLDRYARRRACGYSHPAAQQIRPNSSPYLSIPFLSRYFGIQAR
ncbi:hypothetical protein HRM2_27430 [Desulforapulum autotrophicum HRM2]|uniref:Uncharacterized protein n=1 Tax=Desulforapulum autotrophicum (strain ATCC 43914 / DSM 3382 / VKM B-1955 / HRM2) TaxID=177437 RepID=C0QI99_DESAH|nr:hypothetical protein HRM2_27430 [Desulforapulum autotrophicum HRM2]